MPKGFSFFLCMVILHVSLLSKAQEWNYPYQHIGKEDGLPSNTVYCITSDQNNFLWIGTDAGLVKYDGVNYKVFTTKDGLPSNDVFEVVCDKYNRIWISSMKNSIVYIEMDSVKNLVTNIKNLSINNPKIFKSKDGETWIRTSNFHLLKVVKQHAIVSGSVILQNYENFVFVESSDKFYFLSKSYVITFNKSDNKVSIFQSNFKTAVEMLFLDSSSCYYVDLLGKLHVAESSSINNRKYIPGNSHFKIAKIGRRIWYPMRTGFISVDSRNRSEYKFYFEGIQASSFHLDSLNQLWFCSLDKGIFKLVDYKIRVVLRNSDFTSIAVNGMNLILGQKNGKITIMEKSGKLNRTISPEFLSSGNFKVWKIVKTKQSLYACTDRGLVLLDYSNAVSYISSNSNSLKGIVITGDTALLLNNIGVYIYNLRNKNWMDSLIKYKRFYSAVKYKDSWILGSQDSLYKFNNVLVPYKLNIPFDYRAMDLDIHDSLLIATTAEKGIFIIKDHTVLKNLNLDNGMVTNTCNNTVVYKNILYTATNHGIHIYDIAKDSLSYFFESDGLASNNVSDLAIDADTLYAATENGLSVIPLSVLTPRKPFPCFLQPIYTATDTLWDTPDTIQTRTDQVVFATLNGLSFTSKIPVRFYYRIREQDTSYRETREQNLELRFDKPGYHTFEAYALNGDLQKSEFVTLTVFVDPYFYQTIWFKILMVLLGIGLLGTTYFVLLYLARKRSKSKHETANKMHVLELTAWRSTVHPHFLFNAMNTMLGLLQNSNFDSANQYIFEFSKMLRKTIDQSGKIMVTIEEEENYLTNYLEFEKAKRNGNLNFEIVIDNTSVRDFFIPSMVIQPILENALKHGLKPRKRGKIRIEFYIKGEFMVAEIRDNGIGFDSELGMAKAGSKGLKLIYDKLNIVEKVLKTKIPLDFKNLTDYKGNITGTQTVFQFPLLNDISHIPGLLPHQDEKANP